MNATKTMLWTLLPLMASYTAMASSYICTHKGQQRLISVVYLTDGAAVPCEVHYQKDGQQQTLWQASKTIGFCEKKAEQFMQKQQAWGWDCQQSSDTEIKPHTSESTEQALLDNQPDYQRSAKFSAIFQAVMPIKLKTDDHARRFGEFPADMAAMGLDTPEYLHHKKYDRVKVDNGVITVEATDDQGEPTVLRMTPQFSSGGTYVEWNCNTNLTLVNQEICPLQPALAF